LWLTITHAEKFVEMVRTSKEHFQCLKGDNSAKIEFSNVWKFMFCWDTAQGYIIVQDFIIQAWLVSSKSKVKNKQTHNLKDILPNIGDPQRILRFTETTKSDFFRGSAVILLLWRTNLSSYQFLFHDTFSHNHMQQKCRRMTNYTWSKLT